jgi:hypothetical protein
MPRLNRRKPLTKRETPMSTPLPNPPQPTLKLEQMANWLKTNWMSRQPTRPFHLLVLETTCTRESILKRFSAETVLEGGWRFIGYERDDVSNFYPIDDYSMSYGEVTQLTGAFRHKFIQDSTQTTLEIAIITSYYASEYNHIISLGCLPVDFVPVWISFAKECDRLDDAIAPKDMVHVIGGNANSFKPTVNWDEIILPTALKDDILGDVAAFFRRGVEVYRRLNLKPFRKLLLAGVPGTGKTMICSALAKWAIGQEYLVIYVSSAVRRPGEFSGASFSKIEEALEVARDSKYPTLILVEELDAYLHKDEKALVLNVLDGSETALNEQGTLLLATTNYPEAIDERVLKRPGRLDRIFIIPETRTQSDAEAMLRKYLGVMWQDDHRQIVPQLVGYPGAFIREVAVSALTQIAYHDIDELSLETLRNSFRSLKDQIEARDDFLTRRMESLGFGLQSENGR